MKNPAQPGTVPRVEPGRLSRGERIAYGRDGAEKPGRPADWESIWASCWKRIRRWRVPPHWSGQEWVEEMRAEGVVASLQAESDFDPSYNVPLAAYIRMRVLGGAITRYRQEWSYANRAGSSLHDGHSSAGAGIGLESNVDVRLCMSLLAESDRRIIERLFWGGETESEIARTLGVTQQSISKRKRAILTKLRSTMAGVSES